MTDTSHQTVSPRDESSRTIAIIVYLLYLAALINGLTAVIGVILAYVKRDEVRGTVYESHFANAIELFWIFLVGMLIAVPLCFVLVGIPLVIALYVFVLYRTIKGVVRASDWQPYY